MPIELDGSHGEGGGQILRTALSLAMITGKAIRIYNIRGKRKKPGLMRQHLTAVQAAAQISSAEVEGDFVGSQQLTFKPKAIQGGRYQFNIGTAGSCTLVLQTILPALLYAGQTSQVQLTGGTHNSMSPPFHFLQRAFIPLLQRMGAEVELNLERFGFYPAGGGKLTVTINPCRQLQPLYLLERGERLSAHAESYFAGLPVHIAERELAVVKQQLNWNDQQLALREINHNEGPGNILLLTLNYQHITEVFAGFAEKGVTAETVASKTVKDVRRYLANTAVAGEYLTDQLLLPMALAGSGSFTAQSWSQHAATNAWVIQQFLPVIIHTEKNEEGLLLVSLSSKVAIF